MAIERTLSIIKPDGVRQNAIGDIIHMIEQNGLKVLGIKMVRLTKQQTEGFYAEHKDKPFFGEIIDYMTSDPVIVQVIEGENAIAKYRALMGATNPENAEPGTIRAIYGSKIPFNAVHGSDSAESAQREIYYFFSEKQILPH